MLLRCHPTWRVRARSCVLHTPGLFTKPQLRLPYLRLTAGSVRPRKPIHPAFLPAVSVSAGPCKASGKATISSSSVSAIFSFEVVTRLAL